MKPEATFSIAIVRDIAQYVAAQGISSDSLYRAAGIESTWLADPDRQISGALLQQLWREAIAQTGDRDLGLHIGEAFDLTAISIVGYVLLNCQTYGQVLEKLSQYTRLFSQGVAIHHRVSSGWVECDCEVLSHVKNYLLQEPRHPIESTFAALATATKQITGQALRPDRIWFQHPRPDNCTEHQRIFQTAVQFSQPVNRIFIESACLDWPIRSANSRLLSVFERHASDLLAAQNLERGYRQKVMAAIAQQLQAKVPRIETIARHLTVSVRQLQRELQAENTTYQQLLDDTRKALALSQMKHPETSIHDVAFLLGFSEPSAFHRAFKRWAGQTPHRYRAAMPNKQGIGSK